MTSVQLYVALGIPPLLALTNIAVTVNLIGRVDARFFQLFGRHDEATETFRRKA